MNDEAQRKLTGISGILAGVLALIVVPLYFIYYGPPPAWNVLTRTLFSVVMLSVLMVFFVSFRQLIRKARMAIARNHQLFIVRQQGIQRVEEFFLGRRLARQKMQVVQK